MRMKDTSLAAAIQNLVNNSIQLWWQSEAHQPDLGREYSLKEQVDNEAHAKKLIEELFSLAHSPPASAEERGRVQARLVGMLEEFAKAIFPLEDRHLGMIRTNNLEKTTLEFTRKARQFDPHLSTDEIFQALRNVWSMNFIQLFLGCPVKITPSVFAYSLLYPYSDNLLDDPAILFEDKRKFSSNLHSRLLGHAIQVDTQEEAAIDNLITLIEGQYNRSRFPHVYASLLAIHESQVGSLDLTRGDISPYEVDVLRISLQKGGVSVLADGYLVNGALEADQRELLFTYGSFTQLVDDLQDVQDDLAAGIMTLFSQTSRAWPLDNLTNRTINYGQKILDRLELAANPSLKPLADLMKISVVPLLIEAASDASCFFSDAYMRVLQAHFPLRFAFLRQQRRRLFRRRSILQKLFEEMMSKI
jgi:hypothetical protein